MLRERSGLSGTRLNKKAKRVAAHKRYCVQHYAPPTELRMNTELDVGWL